MSSASGAICLDILKDQWSPVLTLKTALLSLQALLSSPEPDDPQVGLGCGSWELERCLMCQSMVIVLCDCVVLALWSFFNGHGVCARSGVRAREFVPGVMRAVV